MSIFLQLLFTIITLTSLYALVSVGFTLIYAVSGVLHVAQGVVVLEGAYVFIALVQRGVHPLLAGSASVVVGITTGLLINAIVFERLRRRGRASPVGALIASVALLMLGTNLLLLIFGPATKTLAFLETAPRFHWFGATANAVDLFVVAAAIAVLGAVAGGYRWTKTGIALRAVADNSTVAEIIGINTRRIRHLAFALGSGLAAIAGILFALKFGLEPNQSLPVALKAFGRAVVGGIGSIPGAILGNLILETAENVGAFYVSSAFKDVFSFIVIFLFLLLRPHGVLGQRRD